MNGGEDTLGLLEEDIVVHESWWCCGPQIAVEEDMVVKLGPLVAVVVVEAAAAASAASAATAAVCCLLSAVCCLLLAAVCCYCCLCCYHVAVHRICSTSLRYREADQLINYILVLQQQVCNTERPISFCAASVVAHKYVTPKGRMSLHAERVSM